MKGDSLKVPEPQKSSPNSSSSIPKPMAAVKGTAKPTHLVAPMPQTPVDKPGDKVTATKVQKFYKSTSFLGRIFAIFKNMPFQIGGQVLRQKSLKQLQSTFY